MSCSQLGQTRLGICHACFASLRLCAFALNSAIRQNLRRRNGEISHHPILHHRLIIRPVRQEISHAIDHHWMRGVLACGAWTRSRPAARPRPQSSRPVAARRRLPPHNNRPRLPPGSFPCPAAARGCPHPPAGRKPHSRTVRCRNRRRQNRKSHGRGCGTRREAVRQPVDMHPRVIVRPEIRLSRRSSSMSIRRRSFSPVGVRFTTTGCGAACCSPRLSPRASGCGGSITGCGCSCGGSTAGFGSGWNVTLRFSCGGRNRPGLALR